MSRLFWVFAFIGLSSAGVASFSGTDVLFFRNAGHSIAFIGFLYAAFNLAVSVAELPFAVLFDRVSSKLGLQVGNALRIGAFMLFFSNLGATGMVVGQVAAGIGVAASSGTANALVLNEVKERTPDAMATAFGRIRLVSSGVAVVAGLLGIVMFSLEPGYIWLLAIAFFVAAAITLLFVRDTVVRADLPPFRDYATTASKVLFQRAGLALVLSNATAVAPFLLWQLRFGSMSLLFLAVGLLIVNGAAFLAPLVQRWARIKPHHISGVAVLNALAIAGFGWLDGQVLIAAAFFLHVLAQTLQSVLAFGAYHATVDNSIRATAGSVVSLLDSLVVAVAAPVVGIIATSVNIGVAALLSCALCLALAAVGVRTRPKEQIS